MIPTRTRSRLRSLSILAIALAATAFATVSAPSCVRGQTTFATAADNLTTTLGSGYTAGSGSMVVATGDGAKFAAITPAISSTHPVRITVYASSGLNTYGQVVDPTKVASFLVTGVSGNTLTVTLDSGTSQNFASGSAVAVGITAKSLNAIHTAVNTLETAGYVTASTAPVTSVAGQTGAVMALSSGNVTAAGSTTPLSLAARHAQVFNVKDYGAVGDGSTDDQSAIQATLDACLSAGGGIVTFPQATYKVNSYHPSGNTGTNRYSLTTNTTTRPLVIQGNGSTITTPLYVNDGSNPDSGSNISILFFMQGSQSSPSISDLNCVNTHPAIAGETCAVYTSGGTNNAIKYLSVKGSSFRNFSRAVFLSGVVNPLIQGNRFLWDLGRDSGSTTFANPNTAIWGSCNNNGQTFNTQVIGNYFDGCVNGVISGSASNKVALDNFIIGVSNGWTIVGNTIRNHGVEAIFLGSRQVSGSTPSTTLSANYTAASGTMSVANGAIFGSPTSAAPAFAYVINSGTATVFSVTAVSGNTLTIGGAVHGTADQSLTTSPPMTVMAWGQYPSTISGNTIDSLPTKGNSGLVSRGYSIRVDESNVTVTGNTITHGVRPILAFATDTGYPTGNRQSDLTIVGNNFGMAGDGGITSDYGAFLTNVDRVTIASNRWTWGAYTPVGSQIQGVYLLGCTKADIRGNTIESLTKSGGNALTAFKFTSVSDVFLDGNTIDSVDYAYTPTDSSAITVKESTLRNVTTQVNGTGPGLTIRRQRLTWTPPTGVTGYYRIAGPYANWRGHFKVQGDIQYDNKFTNVEFDFTRLSNTNGSTINQTAYWSYNNGVISKARLTPPTGNNGFLDIFVSSATAPPTNALVLTLETEQAGIFLSDTPTFTSDATAAHELTFGHGFRSTIAPSYGGNQLIGSGSSTLVPADITRGITQIDAAAGSATVTLPNANSLALGQVWTFWRIDTSSNTVTIQGNSQTISGQSSVAIPPRGTLEIMTNGGTIWLLKSRGLVPATDLTGLVALANGGTGADLSATGGSNQFVKQSGSGSALTVGTIGTGDLPTIPIAGGGSGQTSANGALNAFLPSQATNNGKVLSTDGTNTSWISSSGSGTVTSVALTLPAIFSVSGSPITAAGTLAATLATQSANVVFAGPTTGSAAAPTFRSLVAADLPTVAIAGGGTGQTTANAALNALLPTQTSNSGKVLQTDGTNTSWSTAGSGTVTSVGLSLPAIFSVSGSPVTTSGTLTGALANQSANLVFAGPGSGSAAGPTFRSLVTADLPLALTDAGVKTTTYTASANQLVRCDTTSGSFTVTLPTAPAVGTQMVVKMIVQASTNTVTVACGGTDVFNKSGGSTSGTLSLLNQALNLVYTTGIWVVTGDDLSLSSLDARYSPIAGGSGIVTVGTITTGVWNGSAVPIANGGTGQTSASAAFNGLSPITTLGDLIYGSAANTSSRLAGQTTTTKKFLSQTGNGTVSAAPAWAQPASADISDIASLYAALGSANTFTHGQVLQAASSEVGLSVKAASNADSLNIKDSGGTTRVVFDKDGYGFPRDYTFALAGAQTTGNDKTTNWVIVTRACKITKAFAIAKTGPTGAAMILDIDRSTDNGSTWTSIWASTPSNRVQIAAAAVAGTQTSFDTTLLTEGDVLRIDVPQIGSTIAGSNVTVQLLCLTRNQ
jgi:Pectate lyase superfamily protein